MDVGTVRTLGSPEGRAILRSLPPYDEREVMRLGDRMRREGHSPDLVAALIPSGCGGRIPEAARPAILARGTDAETGGMAAVVEGTIERWFTPGFRATAAVDAVRRRLLADDPSGWSAAWEAIAGHDALDRLAAVQVPALVIGGEADAATPVEAARALAAAIPGAELAILPGAPHMMQIESPDLYAAAIEGFLARRGL